jgi:REP element-mobilizing transposase RayT
MASARKKHIQQDLFGPRGGIRIRNGHAPRSAKKTNRSGLGRNAAPKRKRGRPPKGRFAGAPHKARPELKRQNPVHVVLRVVPAIGSLRKRFMYSALREATIAVAMRELNEKENGAFRIVHVSIQRDHVHLLVEADNKFALSRGMQSFQISAAKHLNRAFSEKHGLAVRRRGTVFPDRFHQEVIKTPRQARNALAYVLNNWRKHREDRGEQQSTWNVDPFSSGALFGGWKALEGQPFMWRLRATYDSLVVYLPKTWLLYEGWRRHGLIRFNEVPSEAKLGTARDAKGPSVWA